MMSTFLTPGSPRRYFVVILLHSQLHNGNLNSSSQADTATVPLPWKNSSGGSRRNNNNNRHTSV
jgi:hypothetical protein